MLKNLPKAPNVLAENMLNKDFNDVFNWISLKYSDIHCAQDKKRKFTQNILALNASSAKSSCCTKVFIASTLACHTSAIILVHSLQL